MKITMYKLLEMITEGKAPKTIKSEGHYYNYNELEKDYYEGMGYDYEYLLANTSVKGLDNEIEIIEDTPKEEKKIPDDLYCLFTIDYNDDLHEVIKKSNINFKNISEKLDKIIDYLDYLKSKGE